MILPEASSDYHGILGLFPGETQRTGTTGAKIPENLPHLLLFSSTFAPAS